MTAADSKEFLEDMWILAQVTLRTRQGRQKGEVSRNKGMFTEL